MAPKTFFAAVGALVAAVAINAQAAPNWAYIPTACESQCSETIETSYLCQQQNQNSGTQTYGCFCAAYPSDASGCASCLNDNDSNALASLLTSTETDCPAALQQCTFACAFDTCPEGDVACACSETYLANIYNCASCNTANSNPGTGITDFEALRDSCANQGYAGANQTFATRAANAPTGQDSYQAPTLTATGGGAAATGDSAELGAVSASGNGAGAAPTDAASPSASDAASASESESESAMSAPTTMSRASSVSASRMSSVRSGASSASNAGASASSAPNGAMGVTAPATGVVAILGAVLAFL